MPIVRTKPVVMILAAAGLHALSGCGLLSYYATESSSQTVDLPASGAIMVTNDIGSTVVRLDPAATQATVEITRRAIAIGSKQAARDLLSQITVTVTPPSAGDPTLTIAAPRPAGVEVGPIFTNEARGKLTFSNTAEVHLRITLPPGHPVNVIQLRGEIRTVDLNAESVLTSAQASIRSRGATARVTATSKTGDIAIVDHHAPAEIASDAGSALVELESMPAGETLRMRLITGDARVELARDLDATLVASTQTGRVRFSRRHFAATSNVQTSDTSATAILNDGGSSVDLDTQTGSISVGAGR